MNDALMDKEPLDKEPLDKELRLIRHLYGEDEHPEDVQRLLTRDPALREEYRQLKALKDQLDARSRSRPEAATVDRVVAAAAVDRRVPTGSAPRDRAAARTDRSAVRRAQAPQRRLVGVASALVAVLLVVGVGWWQWGGEPASSPLTVADAESTAALRAEPSAASNSAVSNSAASGLQATSLPEWDEGDDLVRLHRYIETLQARSSPNRWDAGASLQLVSQPRAPGR